MWHFKLHPIHVCVLYTCIKYVSNNSSDIKLVPSDIISGGEFQSKQEGAEEAALEERMETA